MTYAAINVPAHYVRIMRGAAIPLGDVSFSLADYLDALFEAQEVTLVDAPNWYNAYARPQPSSEVCHAPFRRPQAREARTPA